MAWVSLEALYAYPCELPWALYDRSVLKKKWGYSDWVTKWVSVYT